MTFLADGQFIQAFRLQTKPVTACLKCSEGTAWQVGYLDKFRFAQYAKREGLRDKLSALRFLNLLQILNRQLRNWRKPDISIHWLFSNKIFHRR